MSRIDTTGPLTYTRLGSAHHILRGDVEADSLTPDDIAAHRIYVTLAGPQPPINVLGRLIPSTMSQEPADSPGAARYRKRRQRLRVRRQLELLAVLTQNRPLASAIARSRRQRTPTSTT